MKEEVSVVVVHPSIPADGRWIDDFVDPAAPYRFVKVGAEEAVSWHRRGKTTNLAEWRRHFRQARRAMNQRSDVVIANFPPLTLACCFWKAAMFSSTRVIGWSFNFGGGSKGRAARVAGKLFKRASLLITHSRGEIPVYAKAFDLPESRLTFVPCQRGTINVEPSAERFDVIAMGSAGRDYRSFCAAVEGTGLKTLLIAKPDVIQGIDIPANVEVRNGLSMAECLSLSSAARVNVVPIAETQNAAGQVTFLTAMAMGKAIVATDCTGTRDYLTDGQDALLVAPKDVAGLRNAILSLMEDQELCDKLARAGYRRWQENFSDEAAGKALREVLDRVTGNKQGAASAPEMCH
ncbi:glycosyltransferase family 4 protein [Paracoccus fistulariae]|uniref:Glycosyltransferase family 4 protein n=1 Tax=Paracoccus fistulariae TaxID=658446 RepID=A0ABY7SQ17_9RHOB|nr:glycosyltransferase family 4 protein [Paracoccus fistulariae]MDB6180001.1 glycosyltransferase family 4 protein [Paracoccus fistulariae]WCR08092.1 glycosyltransferase family 4 protein [Paracoccus fistulariae]